MTKQADKERDEALTRLREHVKPGDTVYTVLRHVSRSGMLRTISAFAMIDGRPVDITGWVAQATRTQLDLDRFAVRMGGCGTGTPMATMDVLPRSTRTA